MNKMKILLMCGAVLAFLLIVVVVCYGIVWNNADGKHFDDVNSVPFNETGLLLGTSPITRNGVHNYYFDYRIHAAVDLYKHGKIKRIIASGGNYAGRQKYGCNELVAMRDSLKSYGVPDSAIILDYQGTRTVASIINAKERYGVESLTFISQRYHNERAIWLAEHYGLEAVAFDARIPHSKKNKIRNVGREFLARVKMFIDLGLGGGD